MLIVHYHQTRITPFSLGTPKGKGDSFAAADRIWISPGVNYITDPKVAKLLQENPEFQKSLEATKKAKAAGRPMKGCEIIQETKDEAGAKNPYKAVEDEEILALIAQTDDVAQLEAMATVEDRAHIQSAITKRLAEIRAGGPAEDDVQAGEVALNQTN